MWDELDEPLGVALGAGTPSPIGRMRTAARAAIGVAAVAAAIGLIVLLRQHSPRNGEPFAVAKVAVLPAPRKPDAPDTTASVRQTTAPPSASALQAAPTNAIKVARGSSGASKALIIDVAQALGVKLAPAPDPHLVEKSKYGLLPCIGPDGARPFEAYARAVEPGVRSRPRIALVVSGLGLDGDSAESAIAKLPGAVTLGFAPTGSRVEQQATHAREAGHETVLQTRLGESSVDTGDLGSHNQKMPSLGVDNLDSLRWQMGQFTGYVAVVNDFASQSVADQRTIAPLRDEIARRGLGYLDDAPSPSDVTNDLAASAPILSAHADIVIDSNAPPEAVEAALSRLVEVARQRGAAIGVAEATPSTIDRLARWGNELEAKSIALVPLSALMPGSQERSARLNRSFSP